MAKKKTEPPKDQHKSGFMVRLPEPYRAAMMALKAKNKRPMTSEIQIALDKHLKDEGMQPPTFT